MCDVLVKPDLPENPTQSLLASLPILTSGGARISLGDVSRVDMAEGVARVFHEDGRTPQRRQALGSRPRRR